MNKGKVKSRENLVDKYSPKRLEDLVGNKKVKDKIRRFVDNIDERKLPHILLVGPSGVGKTTLVKIIVKMTGYRLYPFNASDERGIDVIRKDIKPLARRTTLDKPKIIFLDEFSGDVDSARGGLTSDAQEALRRIIERDAVIGRSTFIATGNTTDSIIPAILSRFTELRMKKPSPSDVAKALLRICTLEKFKISFKKGTEDHENIRKILEISDGDVRKAINLLEEHLDENGHLLDVSDVTTIKVDKVVEIMKNVLDDGKVEAALTDMREFLASLIRNDGEKDRLPERRVAKIVVRRINIAIDEIDEHPLLIARLHRELSTIADRVHRGEEMSVHFAGFIGSCYVFKYGGS